MIGWFRRSRVAMDTSLQLGIWHPANLLGSSSQAHLFVMSLNVAKYHLGKVKM